MLAHTSITVDPAWPWSLPAFGISALGGVAILLTALTVWAYLGVRGATWRRIGLVLALRLLALVVAFVVVLRPSLAFDDTAELPPSRLFFLLDYSESMKITDGFDSLSRWDDARRILSTPTVKGALKKLTDSRVELVYYQGAEDFRKYDPAAQPTGTATDMGTWLHEFYTRHGQEKNLRGLVLLSDGADNGTKFPTLDQAAQLRGICPIFSVGLGKATTTTKQNDIALTDIHVSPDPIPVKSQMTVTGIVDAPGFENSSVNVSLYLAPVGAKEATLAASAKHILAKTQGNKIVMHCDAPEAAGEIKITLKIEPLVGEVNAENNEISTFASVTKDGVSVLWVEGRRRYESAHAIRYALKTDRRFRVFFTERLNDRMPGPDSLTAFNFDKRHYDVIVIGDISAKRFAGGDPSVFKKIQALVTEKGTGLLFMGGYATPWGDGNDWSSAAALPLTSLLPVAMDKTGQIEGKVQLVPTADGNKYVLRLDDDPAKIARIWAKDFDPLDGVTALGSVKPTSTLLAYGAVNKEPLLVEGKVGNGRVLAFAGDTTWKVWRRTPPALPAYARFWRQLLLYAAGQENSDSSVKIVLDKRRVAAGGGDRLPFTVSARGANGRKAVNPQFAVKVIGPDNEATEVPVTLDGSDYRGSFLKINSPGVYRLEASVHGKDIGGAELTTKPSVAHFLGYAQDREMARSAADHEHLAKIAAASGGRFMLADERKLASLLTERLVPGDNQPRAKIEVWPDWRRGPASPSASDQLATLWNSTALPCFVAFVGLLGTEWYLRRRWGMV